MKKSIKKLPKITVKKLPKIDQYIENGTPISIYGIYENGKLFTTRATKIQADNLRKQINDIYKNPVRIPKKSLTVDDKISKLKEKGWRIVFTNSGLHKEKSKWHASKGSRNYTFTSKSDLIKNLY